MAKLLIVDAFVNSQSPTMRGIVSSLDAFVDLFENIEVWSTECEWKHPNVTFRRVSQPLKSWQFHAHYFNQTVRRWAAALPPDPTRLVQVSGCTLHRADIRYIQFWNQLYLIERKKRPQLNLSFLQLLQAKMTARTEKSVICDTTATGEWWVVSRALADSIKQLAGGAGTFKIQPNLYNPVRFNQEVRNHWRDKMRHEYGFLPHEHILVFSAFGHFERKGLRQAVEAVELLRQKGHPVRLLILGGSPTTVRLFQNSITHAQQEACLFSGMVNSIERHLAAADGFLFPSHFEAFSLAEIEAAALGLRLYLTPHYGSEMILREPENGMMLPWDVPGIAKVIEEDISNCRLEPHHKQLGEALSPESYSENLRTLYLDAIKSKLERNLS